MSNNKNDLIQSLWIGNKLTTNEVLCINSYIQNGHKFDLYAYDHFKNVPAGANVKDATEIIPISEYNHFLSSPYKGKYAFFADLFRYKLLFDLGGWWSDLDAICLKPYDFQQQYVFINEKTRDNKDTIANGIIKCPINSPIMQYCYKSTESMIIENKIERWGQTGPALLGKAVQEFNLSGFTVPSSYFVPYGYFEIAKIVKPNLSSRQEISNSYSVHLFNSTWEKMNLPKSGFFHSDSLYEHLKVSFGVNNSIWCFTKELVHDLLHNPIKKACKIIIDKLHFLPFLRDIFNR